MFGIGKLIGTIFTIGAVAGGLYFGSAWVASANTLQALQNADEAALAQHVDFDAVRENLKKDMVRAAENRAALDGMNALVALGAGGAGGVLDAMLEQALTPETVAKVLENQRPKDAKTHSFWELIAGSALRGRFEGQDRFNMRLDGARGEEPTYLIFERRNLIGWQVIEVQGDFRIPGA